MLYLEHNPAPPLRRFVRLLWYARAPQQGHRRERVLPTGRVQVILNLARDYTVDCQEGQPDRKSAPSLVVGARSIYEIVDTSDMHDLIGIVFEPGAFPRFARDSADRFSNRSFDLELLLGSEARHLRDRLREISTPQSRLQYLEDFLAARLNASFASGIDPRHGAVAFAIHRFEQSPSMTSVSEVARQTGWSQRRFSQIFREQVGFSPKVWCRIQRFQRAVKQLHVGVDLPWSELALDCGFYDQSHFANEFRAFSGIDATTYTAARGTPWANHVRVD